MGFDALLRTEVGDFGAACRGEMAVGEGEAGLGEMTTGIFLGDFGDKGLCPLKEALGSGLVFSSSFFFVSFLSGTSVLSSLPLV